MSEKKLKRLQVAVENSRKKIEDFRDLRRAMLKQYVGKNYSENGSEDKVPLPLLHMAVSIYQRHLSARIPRVLIETPFSELKADAADLELATNFWLDKTRFNDVMQRWVTDAMFGMGILKTGLDCGDVIEIDGKMMESGTPFCDTVDLDDAIWDAVATRWDQTSFIGNYYRLPLEAVKESDLYDKKLREKLKATDDTRMEGDGVEPIEELGLDGKDMADAYEEQVDLVDIWLRNDGLILTLPVGGDWTKPLRETEWTGPDHGPYHQLAFNKVPKNILPIPPTSLLIDLHDLANRLFNKMGRQAEREKTNLIVNAAQIEDGKKLVAAADGEAVALNGANQSSEFHTGGINNGTAAFSMMLKDLFVYFGGNLDSLGGLSPASGTVGQDKLISEAASKQMEAMNAEVLEKSSRVIKDVANYLYTDPLISLPLTRKIPGTDISINFNWGPERRNGDFLAYNFSVDPYSMDYQSPATQTAKLMQVVSQIIVPLMPLLSAQGISVNAEGLLKRLGKLQNIHGLEEILIYGAGESGEPRQPAGERPMKSPVTHRVNERVNRPGAIQGQKDAAMIQTLLGGGLQPKEQATMMRAVG